MSRKEDTNYGRTQRLGKQIRRFPVKAACRFPCKPSLQRFGVSGGGEVAFARAVLTMVNAGHAALVGRLLPHATFAQERGLVHDATEALSRSRIVESIQPGEAVKWDVYDLLLVAHPGVASKVHLWGYKAVLDWVARICCVG